MKIKMLAILLALVCTQAHAISEECDSVVVVSAVKFASVDAANDGIREEDMTQEVIDEYVISEIANMNTIYHSGVQTFQMGATRSEAEDFIDDSNSKIEQPHNRKEYLSQAAKDVFMCGYDEQSNDL